MTARISTRRNFLKKAAAGAAMTTPYFLTGTNVADDAKATSKNDRPVVGCIGTGGRWRAVGSNALKFADCVAVCDVDAHRAQAAAARVKQLQGREVDMHEDYQRILDNKAIDVVTIVTPDHWHAKIAIEAMQAGKDVYCEKPLALTIDEGKKICQVVKETGQVFQVGTQQRSEFGRLFLKAVALVHHGRIGEIKNVHIAIGGGRTSGKIPVADVPQGLNWEKWLGQTPLVDYRYKPGVREGLTRCHREFRWWYEYSGGKMTDWGAHHIDIAQWAIGQSGQGQGPSKIEPLMAKHPVPLKDGFPTDDTRYNCATAFTVRVTFPNAIMNIRHTCQDLGFDNGIMFEGTKGRFLVKRGKITGEPIKDLKSNPLPENWLTDLYKGKKPAASNAHRQNFFESIKSREQPIADVFTHHRALTTCHLSNIAIRLGRNLAWNPRTEQIVGDEEANRWQVREPRKGFEIKI